MGREDQGQCREDRKTTGGAKRVQDRGRREDRRTWQHDRLREKQAHRPERRSQEGMLSHHPIPNLTDLGHREEVQAS